MCTASLYVANNRHGINADREMVIALLVQLDEGLLLFAFIAALSSVVKIMTVVKTQTELILLLSCIFELQVQHKKQEKTNRLTEKIC